MGKQGFRLESAICKEQAKERLELFRYRLDEELGRGAEQPSSNALELLAHVNEAIGAYNNACITESERYGRQMNLQVITKTAERELELARKRLQG